MNEVVECRSCGAGVAVQSHERTARCLYCASPQVLTRPPTADRPAPTFALGFVVTREQAVATARAWVRKPWFAPEAFRKAQFEDIRGLYVPAYLYSTVAHSQFRAQIGENYTVTETYTTTDSQGRTVTRTRTRVETEWRPLGGAHASYVADRVVTASRGVPNHDLEQIEPFDLRALKHFTPAIVSGWVAEEASMSLGECAQLARQEAVDEVGRQLTRFMPGDSHRSLEYQTQVSEEDATLTLLPVWVLPVRWREDRPLVRLLVNGQTGAIYGDAPRSNLKIALAILIPLGLVGLAILGCVLTGMAIQ